MIDYKAIIDSLSSEAIEAILKKLDIPYTDKGDYLLMPTYCHNHKDSDASHKLYYYKDNKIFVCYTNCQNMSIFKFLKNYYEAQDIEYDWYNDIYCLIKETSNYQPVEGFRIPTYQSIRDNYKPRKFIELPQYNEGVLDCFTKYYPPEWLSDNIGAKAMDKYGIRFSISQNKIIIPHRDVDGRLVGIRGRALNEWEIENLGKYMPVQVEDTWYKHPLHFNLYGLYENKDNIKQNKICYICESEKAVLQCESFDMPNCAVAVCGSQFNKYQLNLLLRHCAPQEIVICFDREEETGSDIYFNKLWSICEKYKQYCQFSFIYDRQGITKMKDSPTDNGEQIFKQLLERRVQVK